VGEKSHGGVEVAGCADGAGVEGAGVGEDGVADVVASCIRVLVGLCEREGVSSKSLPISACASGAFGARRSDRRIMFPHVANPYLLSFKIETP